MLVIFWVNIQTLMSLCRAEKARFTSWPVRPLTPFRGCAVIEYYERVGSLRNQADDLQPNFHLVLLAYYHVHPCIILTNSVVGLVMRECRAYKQDVVEPAAERIFDLVHHEP